MEHVKGFQYKIQIFEIVIGPDGGLMWAYSDPPINYPIPEVSGIDMYLHDNTEECRILIAKYAKLIDADWIQYLYHGSRDHIPKLTDVEMISLLGREICTL